LTAVASTRQNGGLENFATKERPRFRGKPWRPEVRR
jgi:hypothetical protein